MPDLKGTSLYFEKNRKALDVLYSFAPCRILRFPGEFLLNRVFSETRSNPEFQPARFDQ